MTQAALLDHVTKTIVERFHPTRIVVFGSHAHGEVRRLRHVTGTLLSVIEQVDKVLYEQHPTEEHGER